MIFVVGDIHGEISKLKSLIDQINKIDSSPTLIFIGDYIDKGEDAKATLDFLVQLNTVCQCEFLIGNHEYVWLGLSRASHEEEKYLLKYGGLNTMKSFLTDDLHEAKALMTSLYSDFFNSLKPYSIANDYFITHSGIPPEFFQVSPDKIPLEKFLFNRYDFIVSNQRYLNSYRVIFGHTGFYYPYVDSYKIGIDTSACYLKDQPITAFCIDNQNFVNSSAELYSIREIQGEYCPAIVRVKPWRLL